jgi:hypothetical protein
MLQMAMAAFGVNKDDEDDKKDVITDLMFLYTGDQTRMAIPSYPDKLYKIVTHIIDSIKYKDPMELAKLFSGGINGVTNTMMSMLTNDAHGRRIYDSVNDSTSEAAMALLGFAVSSRMPISLQTASKDIQSGKDPIKSVPLGIAGFTPGGGHAQFTELERFLMHSNSKMPPMEADKYEHKTELLRAAKGIEHGDTSYLEKLKSEGKISKADIKEINVRAKTINGKTNPKYVDLKERMLKQSELETAYKALAMAKDDPSINKGEYLKLLSIVRRKEHSIKERGIAPERLKKLNELKEKLAIGK